jgi:hypothetical protein
VHQPIARRAPERALAIGEQSHGRRRGQRQGRQGIRRA